VGKKGREDIVDFMVIFRKIKSLLKIIKQDIKYVFEFQPVILKRMDYNEYWRNIKDINEVKKRGFIFSKLIKPGSTVMDIGCGRGENLRFLIEKNAAVAEGIDISSTAVSMAQRKGINAKIADVSRQDFCLSKNYDYIIISEVLEHIPNPEELLSKIKYNFNYALIISIPNIGLYKHRLRLLFGRFPAQWAIHPGEHLRFWTVRDFRWWIKKQGFQIVKTYPTHGFRILYRYFPSFFANSIVYVLRKMEMNK
jgi:methionine biosynthesis protein MetW